MGFTRLSVYMFTHSPHLPIYICLFTRLTYLFTSFTHLIIYPFTSFSRLPVYMFTSLPVYLDYQFANLPVYPCNIYLFIRLPHLPV